MRALPAIALVACTSSSDAPGVAALATCGPGTHEDTGECVADAPAKQLVVRVAPRINADLDGASGNDDERWDVMVFGRNADDTPATDEIVLNTSRPNAGTFDPLTLTLDGGFSYAAFHPCAASTPGCVGALDFTAALASAPTTPVATAPSEIVMPDAIGTLEHCATASGNVFYIEGKKFVRRGALTITNGTFTRGGGDRRATITIEPTDPAQGATWTFDISTVQIAMPLQTGVYRRARSAPQAGDVGIQIFDEDPFKFCADVYRGEFQVHEFVYTTSLQRMTATFRQYCSDARNPNNMVTGCIHVE